MTGHSWPAGLPWPWLLLLAWRKARRGQSLFLPARQPSAATSCCCSVRTPVASFATGYPVCLWGDIGPSLEGLSARASAPEVRERIADPRRFNPLTLMPAYLSLTGLTNVAQAYQGKTILTEQGLDDIVAYLMQSDRVRP